MLSIHLCEETAMSYIDDQRKTPIVDTAIRVYTFLGLAGAVIFVAFIIFGLLVGNHIDAPIQR